MSESWLFRLLRLPRQRARTILLLALPIIGGMASQTILNLIDVFMVSRLGPVSVAAVGLGGFANFMATAFITGLGAGVQAMAARRKGEGRSDEMAVPLNGGLMIAATIAIPASVILYLYVPELFRLLDDDAQVVAAGTPYLQARILAMAAIGANFAFRGYWNGVSLSKLYLRTLLVMHVSNVVISYVLIFGALGAPELGTTGAGVGTAIATYIGTAYYFVLGRKHARDAGFLRAIPSWNTIKTMLRVSIPSGLQMFFLAFGLTVLFRIIGMIGTAELAAANVIINLSMVAFLPGLGLGLASASLVGQALGRSDVDDATQWGWDVVKVGATVMGLLALPMVLAPRAILGAFFAESPEVIEVAILPLRIGGLVASVEAVGTILLNSLTGAGATRMAMMVSIGLQWALALPAAFVAGPVLGAGLTGVWLAHIGFRCLVAVVSATLWYRRRWASVEL